jgi:hypothetical protein
VDLVNQSHPRFLYATRAIVGCAALLAGLALARPARAAVNFVFNFTDAAGVGFNAAGQTGIDRRAGLQSAADYIASNLIAYSATINLDVNGSVTNDTTLASASSNFNATFPGNGFGSQGDVMLKILGGNAADPAPAVADGNVNWNFEDHPWEPASDFQPGEQDLISTAMHELTHAIGFSSDILQNGDSGFGDTPGNPSAWSPFDQWVGDNTGVAIIDGATFALDGSRWNTASIGGSPAAGLRWIGANALAAVGGNPIYLYSPDPWDGGSSGSHLDTDFYTGADAKMMNHSGVVDGLDIRVWSALEIGMLKDIGYSRIGVPEPSAVVLLLGMAIPLATWRKSKAMCT